MVRQLTDTLWWFQECQVKEGVETRAEIAAHATGRSERRRESTGSIDTHLPNNAYLVTGEQTLLFDTLSPNATGQILENLERALDGRDLDYVLPSHPEAPHAANTKVILDEHPEATLLAPDPDLERTTDRSLYHLGGDGAVSPGDRIDLGSTAVTVVEAVIPDHAVSVWLYEHASEALFTVDWFGYRHLDGECLSCVDELDVDLPLEPAVDFSSKALFWFRYADPAKTRAAVGSVFDRLDPSVIAPAHGLVARSDVRDHVELMHRVVDRVSAAGGLDGGEV